MNLLGQKYFSPSFRGVPFRVDVSEKGGGRRVASREYPKRTKPSTEDMGRKQFSFSLEAYVIGDNYLRRRDALEEALNKEGPGELVHPYYGPMQAQVASYRVREAGRDLSIAYFAIEFLEPGEEIYPKVLGNVKEGALFEALALINAASDAFSNSFSVSNVASFVLEEAENKVGQLADLMDAATVGIRRNIADISDFAFRVKKLRSDVTNLIATPSRLADLLTEAFSDLSDQLPGADRAPIRAFYDYFFTFGNDFPTVTQTTPSRVRQAENELALQNFVRQIAIANSSREAVNDSYGSIEDAEAARDELTEQMDSQLILVVDDAVYSDIQALRAQVIQAIPPEAESIPKVVEVSFPGTTDSLTATYRLYGNLDREEDLVDRNQIIHPAFIRGNTVLKVLR